MPEMKCFNFSKISLEDSGFFKTEEQKQWHDLSSLVKEGFFFFLKKQHKTLTLIGLECVNGCNIWAVVYNTGCLNKLLEKWWTSASSPPLFFKVQFYALLNYQGTSLLHISVEFRAIC